MIEDTIPPKTMRFKAKLHREQVSLLHNMITPMSRLSGSDASSSSLAACWTRNGCILYLDSHHMRFFLTGKSQDTDGITCFAELSTTGFHSIFLERRIESAAPNNGILFEIDLAQLKLALKSVLGGGGGGQRQNATTSSTTATTTTSVNPIFVIPPEHQYTVLKLAKRSGIPSLCVDACSVGSNSGTSTALIQVHHAIPIRLLRVSDIHNYLPPKISEPDVQLELPHNSTLRTIVERLKHMSPTLYLEASTTNNNNNHTMDMGGELTVRILTDGASIETFYSRLKSQPYPQQQPQPHGNDERTPQQRPTKTHARVKVDTKKLCASLQYQQQQSSTHLVDFASLCIIENEMVVVHINLAPEHVGFFTYYVPVHYLSDDPTEDY
jgi:HUS1 checkpoint protein